MISHLIAYWLKAVKFFNFFVILKIKILIIAINVKCIYGPRKLNYGLNELVVVCLVRDGELWIKSFIEHYFSMGVKHIVFLDNGSSDETIPISKRYRNITILSTNLPFKYFKLAMRHYLINSFGKGRWSLYVDTDELFDYPFSNIIRLSDFLGYLNKKSYTAVFMHMLEMFSDSPINKLESSKNDSLKETYRYYDISDIRKENYYYRKNIINRNIKVYFGGVRRKVFGTDYELGLKLSKHSLVFLDRKTIPMYPDEHGARNVRVADITCVLFHYKFLGNFIERARRNASEGNYHRGSIEYKRYLKVLSENPDVEIKRDTAQELISTNDLLENGFLIVSEDYMEWVQSHIK